MKLFALGLGLLFCYSFVWAQVPQSKHVWVVTEENHSYESVIGNPAMPYFNSLASKFGLATQYYSEQHNSISALMWLVAGQPVTGNNQTTSCYNVDNVARHLIAQGYRWRSYQEDLPYAGFTGVNNLNYVRRHNPIIDFVDTCATGQAANSVPYTQLAADISNHSTPNYAYITPNLQNDGHDGPLSAADLWLSQNLPMILSLPEFQPGGDGVLFIVWDEADLSSNGVTQDNRCSARISNGCGGRLATVVVGPQVKPGYKSSVRYDHANLLRTICDMMSFASCPGAGTVENPMADFFNLVKIQTPFANSTVASPMHVVAATLNDSPVSATQVYIDNKLKYQSNGASVDVYLPIALGKHLVVVQSWDINGGIHKRTININVQTHAVVVVNPAPNSVVPSPVQISAVAVGQNTVTRMQLYVDGSSQHQNSGSTLNVPVALSTGSHLLAIQAIDSLGNLITNKFLARAATPSVQVLAPAASSTFYGPMYLSTTTVDPTPVTAMQVYLDNSLVYEVSGTGVQTTLPLTTGAHWIVVQAWNEAGATYKRGFTVNLVPVPITISSPRPNTTVASPVPIKASAPSSSPVQTMQIYVDNAMVYQVSGQTVSTSLSLPSGRHYMVVKGWDGSGKNWSSAEYVIVP
jgi:phosphoesterase family protein/Big-like domain-containing protein